MIGGRRVLLLNYEYPPVGGGAGVATAALARALVELGATVDVVTGGGDGETVRRPTAEGGGADRPRQPGPRVIRVRTRRKGVHDAGIAGAGSYVVSAFPVVRRLLRTHEYDIAHIFFSLPTGLLLPLARRAGVPTVLSLRGSDVPGYDPFDRRLKRLHPLLRPVTRALWRGADRVVALSRSLAALARETDPDLEVTVIGNGVDLELFRPDRPVDEGARGGPVRCLAAARLVRRKGVHDLLTAWARLPRGRYRLEIAGEGGEEQRLRRRAEELGVAGEVNFLGVLGRAELAARLRETDLFTLVPYSEAFGNVFAEALASGVPVVASPVGGIPTIVRDPENGRLVPPGRPDRIATAIRHLGERPELRRSIGRRNRARAEERFRWSGMARSYVGVYEAAMAARAGAPEAAPDPEPAACGTEARA